MKRNTKSFFGLLITVLLGMTSHSANAQSLDNLDKNGLALQGYDPVSYFKNEAPKEGTAKFSYRFENRNYYFASQENKKSFMEMPEKYEPAYGGWCAYAIGLDASKVKINPETYKIVDGRLLLFYDFFFVNTLDKWNEDEAGWEKKAAANWVVMVAED